MTIIYIILAVLASIGFYFIAKWLGIGICIISDWVEDQVARPARMKRVIRRYREPYSGRAMFDDLPEHLWDGWWKTLRRWRPWRRR